jgi:uncharacterized membrane protein YgdD (TMEM256/DUF423 family)
MLNSFSRLIIPLGAINALIAVAAGAFAAHGLKNTLTANDLNVFKTAADYQMIHGLGLILIGTLNRQHDNKRNTIAAIIMLIGIIIFSGSLYLLTLTDTRWLGMITPIGGTCFLIAWLILAISHLSKH